MFKYGIKEVKIMSLISPIITLIMLTSIMLIILYGGWRVTSGSLSPGTLTAMIFILIQSIPLIVSIGDFFSAYKSTEGATQRLHGIYNTQKENLVENNSLKISDGNLVLKDVSFKYKSSKNSILKDINVTFNLGEMTAIIGESGAGKTTVLNLISRLFTMDNGTIELNGTNINSFDILDWRNYVGYSIQDNSILNLSLKENLLLGLINKPNDKTVLELLDKVGLTKFVNNLPFKLNSIINEKGTNISGGQRQRLSIARTLIRKPKIILLDEVTSNLDSENEYFLQNLIKDYKENRIIITVAHRISTIKNADKIIIMKSGEIVDVGTHEYLYKSNKYYRKLVDLQYK